MDSARRPWRKILEGAELAAAEARIEAIANALAPDRDSRWISQLGQSINGTAGHALFFAYLELVNPGQGHGEVAEAWLERETESGASGLSLFAGSAGLAWTHAHLHGKLFLLEGDEWSAELDDQLVQEIEQADASINWDLVKGLCGSGIYFLEHISSPRCAQGLACLVRHLGRIAQRTKEGYTWLYPPEAFFFESDRQLCPDGVYNLSTAHGSLGVLMVLAGAVAAGIERPLSQELLEGGMSWFFSHESPPTEICAFPYSYAAFDPGRGAGQHDRVAWCRGDAGSAAALMTIAQACNNEEWYAAALRVAVRAAQRTFEDAKVGDPCLCHGASGVGHLMNRLFQRTGDELFLNSARFWLGKALELCRDDLPDTGGAWSFQREENTKGDFIQRSEAGLLLGASGIGLTLLAAVSDVEPSWDRLFLASLATAVAGR